MNIILDAGLAGGSEKHMLMEWKGIVKNWNTTDKQIGYVLLSKW